MSSRKIELSPEASQDLDDINQYTIERWGIEQAEAYAHLIELAIERIGQFPEIGTNRIERNIEFRVLPIEQHLIFYRVSEEQVNISRIVHRRTDWDPLL